jgi:chromosome segregation ATPase
LFRRWGEREFELRRRLNECDSRLACYRELLEVNSEVTSAATWIAEVERERRSIERDLGRKPTPRKHTKNEIKPLVRQLKDIVGTLANADPEDKRAVYDELGRILQSTRRPSRAGLKGRIGSRWSCLLSSDR